MKFQSYPILTLGLLTFIVLLGSCGPQDVKPLKSILLKEININQNTTGRVPQAARITFSTNEEVKVSYVVNGEQSFKRYFNSFQTMHLIPVIGLYPDTINEVTIIAENKEGGSFQESVSIHTEPLPAFFPTIEIAKLERSKMEPGFHEFDLLVPNNDKFDTYTIIFDDKGIIRWYLDMSETRRIAFSTILKNGHRIYASWIDVFEVNELGETIRQWQLGGYAGDHDIKELPSGNFLMGASKRNSIIYEGEIELKSRYDAVVELDRETMNVTRDWDMRTVLDVDRSLLNDKLGRDNYKDWFHVNSVYHSQADNCILVSGRNQGVVKLDQHSNLKWILAPHKGWSNGGIKGQGENTDKYLLTAIDDNGSPYPARVQEGTELVNDFDWVSGQHSIRLLDNGNILLFDNGYARKFEKIPTYSKAVEYEIDEENRTIKQVWQYGKERGLNMFSAITSDVDVLPQTNNRLITAGYVRLSSEAPHAKMIEVTYPDNKEVFEAKIFFKNVANKDVMKWAKFDIVYRGERITFN